MKGAAGTDGQKRRGFAQIDMGTYTLAKKGVSRYDFADPYRLAVALTWPQFLLALLCLYLSVDLLFALLYFVVPGSVANARRDRCWTRPSSASRRSRRWDTAKCIPPPRMGIAWRRWRSCAASRFTAILTGLIFVRFSKPRAKFIFAEHPVVTTHNGRSTLMLRVGNGRAASLSDARARISVLLAERSAEGTPFRRTHLLKLSRGEIPVFPLTWTLMHDIDEASPLFGLDGERFSRADTRIFVSLEARDPDLAASVHDVRQYQPASVLFGMRYVDVIADDETGRPVADMTRLSEVEPDP